MKPILGKRPLNWNNSCTATLNAKDFSQAFASAAEVVDTHEGDCTEHAVLLAALCRARGIPARVAIGLVYMPATHEFGYHMWTEVYIGKRTKSPLPLGEGKGEGISNSDIGPNGYPSTPHWPKAASAPAICNWPTAT